MDSNKLLQAHRAVNSLLGKLALGLEKDQLNQEIISLSEHLFGERKASILRFDPQQNTLHVEYAPSLPDFYNQAIEGVRVGEKVGSCGAAAFLRQTVVAENINHHSNWQPYLALTQKANLHACWSVPVLSQDEQVLGTFAIYSDKPSFPSEAELEILQMLATLYAVALEKYQCEQQLYDHVNRDPLTQCYNRRMLLQSPHQLFSTQEHGQAVVGCFFVDVDDFKYINDRFGHDVGDQVLIDLAQWLMTRSPQEAMIARYGGDEFVIIATFASEQDFEHFYRQLRIGIKLFFVIEDYSVAVSIGAASTPAQGVVDLNELIRQADLSMYRVKRQHRDVSAGLS